MELSIKKVTKGRVLARAAEAICASVISLAIFPDTVNSAEPALTAPEVEVIGNYDTGIAQLRAPAIWVLPVTFPLVMSFGGILGGFSVPIPGIEVGIALSAIVLGAMVAFAVRPPLWIAGVIVGVFAIFHGYAHGAELPESANAISFAMGFVIATGSLHALGILIGVINKWKAGEKCLRAVGVLISLCGGYFLISHFIGG